MQNEFSDDESVISEQEQLENQEELLEEEVQRELYQSIRDKTSKLDLDSLMTKQKKTTEKPKRVKQSNIFSLKDFNKKMEEEKPKKFVSKRMEDKKKELGVEERVEYRSFNPRKPPYNFINKNRNQSYVNINNNNDFPTLK
jgi:type II secretory pathway component PulK